MAPIAKPMPIAFSAKFVVRGNTVLVHVYVWRADSIAPQPAMLVYRKLLPVLRELRNNLSGSMWWPLRQCGNAKIKLEKVLSKNTGILSSFKVGTGKCEKLFIQLFQRSLQ